MEIRDEVADVQGAQDGRGILYPTRLPTFHREAAPPGLEHLVRWFWVPRWDLAPGRVSAQEILPFPASNLVVQPDGITVSGPTTRISRRELRGSGWAVGALLRPAGVVALGVAPASVRDVEAPFEAPGLLSRVRAAMEHEDRGPGRRGAIEAFSSWWAARGADVGEQAIVANTMEELIAADRSVTRIDQVADRLGLSVRSVQRLAERYVGSSPVSMIRRYRLQEAAQRLREEPATTIADVAADLGYVDHAHLTADFRSVLGIVPSAYRAAR